MKRKWIIAAVVAVPLLAVAEQAAEHKVSQKDKAFSVSEITIKAGESIEFANDDDVAHNVFSSTAGHEFNLKMQPAGTSSSTKFEKDGDVELRCAIHPKMKMTVHVQK